VAGRDTAPIDEPKHPVLPNCVGAPSQSRLQRTGSSIVTGLSAVRHQSRRAMSRRGSAVCPVRNCSSLSEVGWFARTITVAIFAGFLLATTACGVCATCGQTDWTEWKEQKVAAAWEEVVRLRAELGLPEPDSGAVAAMQDVSWPELRIRLHELCDYPATTNDACLQVFRPSLSLCVNSDQICNDTLGDGDGEVKCASSKASCWEAWTLACRCRETERRSPE
jgi:hypothetical protein